MSRVRWLGALLAGSLGLWAACAEPLGGKADGPVVLPKDCQVGPFCVTGTVTDQWANPVEEATVSVIGARGEGYATKTDRRGFYYLDRLPAPASQMRIGKPGFEAQTMPVPAKAQGTASPVYVVLRRLGEADCTCDPNALVSGREPCPPEQCR